MRWLALLVLLLLPTWLTAQNPIPVRAVTATGDTVTVRVTVDSVAVNRLPPPPPVVITKLDTLRDTTYIATPYPLGKPYGTFGLFVGEWTRYAADIEWLTGGIIATSPAVVCSQIAVLRTSKRRAILAMPQTAHSGYLTAGKFDVAKWLAELAKFNLPAVKTCIADGVTDGTVIATELMDEPEHGDWGGVMTHALLDSMARSVKRVFPTIPTAVVAQWSWQKDQAYQSVDLLVSQYTYSKGDLRTYRDFAVESAKQQGVTLSLGMNLLDGGTRIAGCPVPQTGGPGTFSNNCRMTPAQVVEAGLLLAGVPKSCALFMWRVDSAFMANPENKGAFSAVATYAARQPAPPCRGDSTRVSVEPAPTPTPDPTPAPLPTSGYQVATSGTASGDGSAAKPWGLATALAHPSIVQPGDTIWLRGGTYAGCFTSKLNGTAAKPIIVRQYPGERAILDNGTGNCNDAALMAYGAYTWFWGFEVKNSNPKSGGPLGINGYGTELKFINLIVHDAAASGIGFWWQATGGEVYGSIIYNNGRATNLDHGIYTQNVNGTKRLLDNVVFNQFAYGFHVYGSETAPLNGYDIRGNTLFMNGSINNLEAPNLLVGGGNSAKQITIANNMIYHTRNSSGNVWLGYSDAQNQQVTLKDNYIVGGFTGLRVWRWSSGAITGNTVVLSGKGYYPVNTIGSLGGLTWSGNTWYRDPTVAAWFHENVARTWAAWQTASGKGATDTVRATQPTGIKVFVRPNAYEPGRAFVTIYNWDKQSTVAVDLSSVLKPGDRYEIRHVYALNAAPLVSDTYTGGKVAIPMTAIAPQAPTGLAAPDAVTGPTFGVFLVTRVQ